MARPFESKAAKQHSIVVTQVARDLLDALQEKTHLSRPDIVGHLLTHHTLDVEALNGEKTWFPGKVFPPLSLKLTATESQILRRLKRETKHGWGEVVEALLRQHGRKAKYPPKVYG